MARTGWVSFFFLRVYDSVSVFEVYSSDKWFDYFFSVTP